MDIPYPSQHTMSSNHWPASEMPFKCFRCSIAKKEGGGGCVCVGGGGSWRPAIERRSNPFNFCGVFFACVVVFVRFGGRGG